MSNKVIRGNVFITGGAGFIGSHLAERLVDEGYAVTIFDNLHRNSIQFSEILRNPNVTFIRGDILDIDKLKEAMAGSDAVIHLAAIAGVSNYYKFPAKTLKVNLIGTYNVVEAMVRLNIKKLIDMSTSETFGPEAAEVDEASYQRIGPPQDKRWCYAGSKIGSEQLIFRYAEEHGWDATVVRPFNVYGPRQVGEGAIANFCKCIIEGRDLRIEGSGMAVRSWCYISDFVEALILVLSNQHSGPDTYNLGNPWAIASTFSLGEEMLRVAKEVEGISITSAIDFVPLEYTEIRVRYPNINKFQMQYGWRPKVNLVEGIYKTLKWFKESYGKN